MGPGLVYSTWGRKLTGIEAKVIKTEILVGFQGWQGKEASLPGRRERLSKTRRSAMGTSSRHVWAHFAS